MRIIYKHGGQNRSGAAGLTGPTRDRTPPGPDNPQNCPGREPGAKPKNRPKTGKTGGPSVQRGSTKKINFFKNSKRRCFVYFYFVKKEAIEIRVIREQKTGESEKTKPILRFEQPSRLDRYNATHVADAQPPVLRPPPHCNVSTSMGNKYLHFCSTVSARELVPLFPIYFFDKSLFFCYKSLFLSLSKGKYIC